MVEVDVKSVREIIDTAFGDFGYCPIDINKIGSVLYILARQLDILKRQFRIELADKLRLSNLSKASTFAVAEIKIHTKGRRRGRRRSRSGRRILNSKDYSHILPAEHLPSTDKSSSDKRHSEKTVRNSSHKRSGKHLGSSSTEMFSIDEHFEFDKKSRSHKRSGDKHSDEMSPDKRHRTGRYSGEISSADWQKTAKYDNGMSHFKRHRAGEYDDEIAVSERRKGEKYYDKMSSTERQSAAQYDDEMLPTQRRRAGKFTDKMSPSGRVAREYLDDLSPSKRNRTEKLFPPKEGRSAESMLMGNPKTKKYRDQKSDEDDASRKRRGKYDDVAYDDDDEEGQHEKIYIVTRTPSGREIRQLKTDFHPVVTQEQFEDLVDKTRALQRKFGITNIIPYDFNDLKKPTSMSQPRTALNLSVRLNAAENRLARMMDILTQVASQVPGIDLEAPFEDIILPHEARKVSDRGSPPRSESEVSGAISRGIRTGTIESSRAHSIFDNTSHSENDMSEEENDVSRSTKDIVTLGQLNAALQKIYDDATIHIHRKTGATLTSVRNLDVDVTKNELQVHKINKKFEDLSNLNYAVEKFGGRVIDIDQRMTSKITLYQEDLHQMRGDLEIALDKLAEALASPQDDPAAIAQMTETFKSFQIDLNCTKYMQLEFQRELKQYSKSLKNIMEKIEWLRKVKSSRDQMIEALSEKLGIKDLNGLLSQVQFSAIITEFNKKLRNIDYNIYSKECDWQKAIDELYATKRSCADIIQLESLIESVRLSFELLSKDLHDMFDIVGPLKTWTANKKLHREGNCVSCGTPAKVEPNEIDMVLWKEMFPKSNPLESIQQIKEKKIEGICIPGQPIPHPLDQGSFVCEHDCGDFVNTNNLFELVITELSPAQAAQVETQKDNNQVVGHEKSCLCATCAIVRKRLYTAT